MAIDPEFSAGTAMSTAFGMRLSSAGSCGELGLGPGERTRTALLIAPSAGALIPLIGINGVT